MHTYIYIYTPSYMYTHTHIYTYTYIYICLYIHLHTSRCARFAVDVFTLICFCNRIGRMHYAAIIGGAAVNGKNDVGDRIELCSHVRHKKCCMPQFMVGYVVQYEIVSMSCWSRVLVSINVQTVSLIVQIDRELGIVEALAAQRGPYK